MPYLEGGWGEGGQGPEEKIVTLCKIFVFQHPLAVDVSNVIDLVFAGAAVRCQESG